MNCLSRRAEVDVPVTPAFPAPTVPALPIPALPMPPVTEHVAVLAVAGETVGIVGTNELGPTVPTTGNTPVVGTAGAELTPRLLISIEPNGIPVRAPPPGVVDIPDDIDVPEDIDVSGVAVVPDIAMLPVVAAVAGAAVPVAVPPPSKLAVDPNIPDGDIPPVEHVVPLVVIAPLVGIAIVPVTLPVGAGLTTRDVISLAHSGIPV